MFVHAAAGQQVLDQAHSVALKYGLPRSTPLLKQAREFSAEMLQKQQRKKDKVGSCAYFGSLSQLE